MIKASFLSDLIKLANKAQDTDDTLFSQADWWHSKIRLATECDRGNIGDTPE
jgi:hypothetical protein